MTKLEIIYVATGIGIILRGVIDHGLTATELGAAMFFIGLVPVSRADKAKPDDLSIIASFAKWIANVQRPPKKDKPDD